MITIDLYSEDEIKNAAAVLCRVDNLEHEDFTTMKLTREQLRSTFNKPVFMIDKKFGVDLLSLADLIEFRDYINVLIQNNTEVENY